MTAYLHLAPQDRLLIQTLIKELQNYRRINPVAKKSNWGTYEDANKILARSRGFYKEQRNGVKRRGVERPPTLVRGEDWKREGGIIIYNLTSIERLKHDITR